MDTSAVIPTWSDRAWDLGCGFWARTERSNPSPISLPGGKRRSGTRRLLGSIYTEGEFIDEYVEHEPGDFDGEVRDFAAAIRGTQPPDVSPQNALTFMQLLDAIYQSAETGEKVTVDAG